jgi:predicted ATPase with chaperone activity
MRTFCASCDHYTLVAAMNPCPYGYHRVLKLARTIAEMGGGVSSTTTPEMKE